MSGDGLRLATTVSRRLVAVATRKHTSVLHSMTAPVTTPANAATAKPQAPFHPDQSGRCMPGPAAPVVAVGLPEYEVVARLMVPDAVYGGRVLEDKISPLSSPIRNPSACRTRQQREGEERRTETRW